jgi:hypothetical protein
MRSSIVYHRIGFKPCGGAAPSQIARKRRRRPQELTLEALFPGQEIENVEA